MRRGRKGEINWDALGDFVAGLSDDMLRATVAVVPNPENIPQNREGHSICHILAARKPEVADEAVARPVIARILQACGLARQLDHRNCKKCSMVHCAAAQHNYVFLEELRRLNAQYPGEIPWDERGGEDERTVWEKQFVAQTPNKNPEQAHRQGPRRYDGSAAPLLHGRIPAEAKLYAGLEEA